MALSSNFIKSVQVCPFFEQKRRRLITHTLMLKVLSSDDHIMRTQTGDGFMCELKRYPGGHMFDAPDDVGFFSKALMFLRLYPTTREVQLLGNCCVMDGGEKGFIPLNIDGTFDSDFVSWDVYERFMHERVRIGEVSSPINKDSAAMARKNIIEFLKSIGVILDPGAAAAKVWQKWYDDSYCAVPAAAAALPAAVPLEEGAAAAGSHL